MTASADLDYRAEPGRYDEMVGADGEVREVWRAVAGHFADLSSADRADRAGAADRRLVATGAAHSRDGRPAGAWQIDPLPLVFGGAEWDRLAAGLAQRVHLLDLVLDDLYGERRIVSTGLVPAELVLGSDGYQPAAWGWKPRGARVSRYAADVVRAADGSFRVLQDHVDAPAGAARALINRTVTSRVLHDVATIDEVAPLGAFFDRLRAALAGLASPEATSPRVVVLAPGHDDPEFVEYSFLATHLGYNLVETGDLVVSGGHVWLRAIGGLEPVDVVLRGVSDPEADPLELQPFRPGGVPGLVQAAREGTVALANAAGTGLASSFALQPFLGSLCRELLGEDLQLESPETIWCGDGAALRRVLSDLDAFVLHDARSHRAAPSVFGDELDGPGLDEWTARLRSMPFRYVAQPKLELASVPVVRRGDIVPGHATVRLHVVHSPSDTFVMPGGTGRVIDPDVPIARQSSHASKDVWVMGRAPTSRPARVDTISMAGIDLRSSLPSRAAETLYWIGRHAERAEALVLAVRAVQAAVDQDPGLRLLADGAWDRRVSALLHRLTQRTVPARANAGADGTTTSHPVVGVSSAMVAALHATAAEIDQLVEGTATVREFLSATTWQVTQTLAEHVAPLRSARRARGMTDPIVVALAALAGLTAESVVRGPSWRFLDMGRRSERALVVATTLEVAFGDDLDPELTGPLGEVVLASHESLVAYRRRYRTDVELVALADLLLADRANPRSLAFQLARLDDDLAELPGRAGRDRAHTAIAEAAHALETVPIATRPTDVSAVAWAAGRALTDLGPAITATWFAASVPDTPRYGWAP